MKNLINKIKRIDYKQLALERGEHIVLGTLGAILLVCLIMTHYRGYEFTPEDLKTKAVTASNAIDSSQWPKGEQEKFAVIDYSNKSARSVLDPSSVAYSVPMSFVIFPRIEPNKEPTLYTIQDAIASSGRFVMALLPKQQAPAQDLAATGVRPGQGGPTTGATSTTRPPGSNLEDEFVIRNATTPNPQVGPGVPGEVRPVPRGVSGVGAGPGAPNELAGGPGVSGGQTAVSTQEGRGVRYALVRGVFPLQEQCERYVKSLNLDSVQQAIEHLEILDFKIQRQKATVDKNPWAGPWDELNIQTAYDLLDEAEDFAPEVVSVDVTDGVFTMPLPIRLQGRWGDNASHPRLTAYLLNNERMQQELEINSLFLQEYQSQQTAPTRSRKGGFGNRQQDMRQIRTQVVSKMMEEQLRGRRGDASTPQDPQHEARMKRLQEMQDALAMNRIPKMLLFRYLDPTVEPGAAYRYRIKLTLRNPNFNLPLEQVAEASVAQGETRTTDWSQPTPPVVIEPDVEYFFTQVPRGTANRPGNSAAVSIFQWDPEVGTYVTDTLKLIYGQIIGGTRNADRLNVAKITLKSEEVTFNTRDVLVDFYSPPHLIADRHPELGLNSANWLKVIQSGKLDHAIAISDSGELVSLDTVQNQSRESRWKDIVHRQREPFMQIIREQADSTKPQSRLEDPVATDTRRTPRAGAQQRPVNPTRIRPQVN